MSCNTPPYGTPLDQAPAFQWLRQRLDELESATSAPAGPQGPQGVPGAGLETVTAANGSSVVGYRAPGAGVVDRNVAGKLAEGVSVADYGARTAVNPSIFNNQPSFAAALQNNGAYAGDLGGVVTVPAGLWPVSSGISVGDYSTLRGVGPRASVFYNQQSPLNTPAVENTAGQTGFWGVEGMGFRGYNTGVRVTGVTDGLRFRNLHMLLCYYGFQFDNMLQTTVFDGIEFDQCNTGIWSKSNVANRVTVRDCDFKNMSGASILLGGAEDFQVENCRFEGGGSPGLSTLDLSGIRLAVFRGGYFESTHQNLLRLTASPGGVVVFDGVHFTGTGAGTTNNAYEFLTDGTGTIVFRNCHATFPFKVPPNAVLEGDNPGLLASGTNGQLARAQYRPAGSNFDLLSLARGNKTNDPTNTNVLSGELVLSFSYSSADGGVYGTATRRYNVAVQVRGGTVPTAEVSSAYASNTGSAANISVGARNSVDGTVLTCSIPGVDLPNLAVALCAWRFQWTQVATLPANGLVVAAV